jgi:hypothetical protein
LTGPFATGDGDDVVLKAAIDDNIAFLANRRVTMRSTAARR